MMVRGIERRQIVDDDTDRRDFVRRLGVLAEETRTAIYAWALMSNHAHILLCSGALALAKFMRRLLTGYAVSYNLLHRRHGHVFQNRYKSIVCDGDSYFTELVRYVHLNPLRVELVKDLKELEKYPYCGQAWDDSGNGGATVAGLRERAGAVWQASFRCEGGVPEICCRGS